MPAFFIDKEAGAIVRAEAKGQKFLFWEKEGFCVSPGQVGEDGIIAVQDMVDRFEMQVGVDVALPVEGIFADGGAV